MKVAKLAVPIIISRLGDMTSSFILLSFVGHVFPDSFGYVSFAWAFISFSTVVGIGFFSTLMIDIARENKENSKNTSLFINTAIRMAFILGSLIVFVVFIFEVCNIDNSDRASSLNGIVMLTMSFTIPAVYLQIVVFNYFNSLGRPRLELMFVWFFNTVFIFLIYLFIEFKFKLSIELFVIYYLIFRWIFVFFVY